MVAAAAAVWTLWAAVAGVLVLAASNRAVKLARQLPDSYGGYKPALGLLLVTSLTGAAMAGFAISRVPRFLEKRALSQRAGTAAAISELANYIEQYRAQRGWYPMSEEALREFVGGPLPTDAWDTPLSYASYTENIAFAGTAPAKRDGPETKPPGIEATSTATLPENFELRSAGPDGKIATDDDVVMRDGIFYSDPAVVNDAKRSSTR
jgi:hypothetical protein